MKIGIDKLGFYAPHLYVDMNDLAIERGIDPGKFTIGLGQDQMAVPPVTQDPVSLAANAAAQILDNEDKDAIDLVIFGTESGVDHSKSAAVYVHQLLELNPRARSIELKQACYGATAGIQMAKGHIALHPDKKVLVLASDIARYGLNTPGESTQGAGAVAILLSADPNLIELESESTYYTEDIMDFWRPVYSTTAYVDGKYSNEQYIAFFQKVWKDYQEQTGRSLEDFAAIAFHLPYTKMGWKALRTVIEDAPEEVQERLKNNYQISTIYNRNVGNIYTGSLYLSLLSLLENQEELKAGDRIGLYSYGSGAVGEFFSGKLQPGFKKQLQVTDHKALFENRKCIPVATYEKVFEESLPTDGSEKQLNVEEDPAKICLAGVRDHIRSYVVK
ncbi:hydroxymethylglutaryl-CoA synthase [Oceanobacillus sp. J11TS1]|uniref:hydroxymethylglutaryl-CoA synthase n=1 Tax=Oceanobacillus sp. J11TS1 TaxID=2807191 RepID=UPI001B013BF3|nr:hydroxymethylglutaryl-CoA synthase [Oceanobacillus sp. J11TS1]GIO24465.1 hydroxymethylglutaryl-CoA synthase [Oceanobacillus sp. J11TS1]